jgi:transcriptional regulator with XRE-family HTH domain
MSDSQVLIDRHKLQAKRKQANLTQVDLARHTGLGQGYISMLETGGRGGGLKALYRLSSFFDCPVTDLMPDLPRKAAA